MVTYYVIGCLTVLGTAAAGCFAVAGYQACCSAKRALQRNGVWVQRSKVTAGYVPNAPLTPHNAR